MTEWSFGSAIYGDAWATQEMRALFADAPRTRRWLDLLGLLAEVQAEHELIPAEAARDIQTTCRSIVVDAGFLAECREGYQLTCHSMAGLIAAVGRRCSSSGGEWFYFGATVQDITDTWLMLTLREARALLIADLERAIAATASCAGATGIRSWPAERTANRVYRSPSASRLRGGWLSCDVTDSVSRRRLGAWMLASFAAASVVFRPWGPRRWRCRSNFSGRLGLRVPDISWTASRDILAEWAHLLVLSTGTADRIGMRFTTSNATRSASSASTLLPKGSAASPCRINATRRWPSISEPWPAWCGPMPGFLPRAWFTTTSAMAGHGRPNGMPCRS